MAAIIRINGGTPGLSDDNVTIGSSVSLYSVDAATTYQWAIVSQPAGPTDALVTPTQRAASFTASKEGSYLLLLTVDDGLPTESSQQLIAAVRELETGDRVPAIGETTENSANDGWANPVDAILRRVTQFTEAGVQPGVAAESLTVGDVVYAGDVYTLAAGLPGERVVANWSKAHADVPSEVQGVFGVVAGSVNGGSIAASDVITVQTTGLYQGVPFGSAPSVGDPVYISDAAGLALTQGTIKRQIGTVCAVGASTFDVMVGPAPAELATATLYAKTYWVSTAGSDVVGDGSIINPFATPQKAHDVAIIDYPTDWVSVEIGPGSYVGSLTIEKWNIVFHGSGSRPETQATKLLGVVTVTPDAATQKFNEVVGLDRLYVEPPSVGGVAALYVTGTGAFSVVVTDCYLTTASASATATVFVEPSNAIRPRVTINDCIISVQTAGPDIVVIDKGDVRVSNVQALFGSAVSSGSAGRGFVVNNDASLFADRLLLDVQTIGPAIEVTGSLAGTKLTLSGSSITLSYATCSHGISVTNSSAGQLAAFVWNTVFGVTNLASKAIFGSGSVGTNIVNAAQLSYIFGTSSAIGSAVTLLGMTGDVAGGDLSGNLPSPTVAKLQGRAVSATAPSSGEVLGWNGSAWAPTTNSASPTGSAGGVLGYTSSTYPNPSGLAPTSGTDIPVAGAAGTSTRFKTDDSSGATQSTGIRLSAGTNSGSGRGGDARLVGGGSGSSDASVLIAYGASNTVGGAAEIAAGFGPIGGDVTLTAGLGNTTLGGDVTITAGESGAGVGGLVSITAGQGNGGDGGTASLRSGAGTNGGDATITSGSGLSGNGGVTYAQGGAGTIDGGGVVVRGGGAGTGNGGSVAIEGGASTGERGGSVSVTGGDSTGMGAAPDGGSVEIDAGTGQTNGHVRAGATNAEYVSLGRSGKDVIVNGRNVSTTNAITPVAATPITVASSVILLSNAGAVDLGTANATIQTSGITAGTRVTFIQNGAGTTTFRRGGSTLLKLSAASHAVAQYHTLELIYSGAFWCEIAFANNN